MKGWTTWVTVLVVAAVVYYVWKRKQGTATAHAPAPADLSKAAPGFPAPVAPAAPRPSTAAPAAPVYPVFNEPTDAQLEAAGAKGFVI